MRTRRLIWPLTACLVAFATSPAYGQSTAEKTRAEALFREGRALLGAGRAAEACGKFEESERLDPQLGTMHNLAVCHGAAGKTATGWAELRAVAERADLAGDPSRARTARRQADALEPKLARLRFVVPAELPSGATIALDREPVGRSSWQSPLPVDPGEHMVEVAAPGRRPWSRKVTATEASTVDVVVPQELDSTDAAPPDSPASVGTPLAPAEPSPPPPYASAPERHASAPERPARRSGNATLGIAAFAVAAVGIGVGTIFGLQAIAKKSDADELCPNDRCTPRGHAFEGDARTASIVSTLGFGVGVVALAAGAYFVFFQPSKRSAMVNRGLAW